jgi:hypothetical protein
MSGEKSAEVGSRCALADPVGSAIRKRRKHRENTGNLITHPLQERQFSEPCRSCDKRKSLGISRPVLTSGRKTFVYTTEKLLKNAAVEVQFSSRNIAIFTSRFSVELFIFQVANFPRAGESKVAETPISSRHAHQDGAQRGQILMILVSVPTKSALRDRFSSQMRLFDSNLRPKGVFARQAWQIGEFGKTSTLTKIAPTQAKS